MIIESVQKKIKLYLFFFLLIQFFPFFLHLTFLFIVVTFSLEGQTF